MKTNLAIRVFLGASVIALLGCSTQGVATNGSLAKNISQPVGANAGVGPLRPNFMVGGASTGLYGGPVPVGDIR